MIALHWDHGRAQPPRVGAVRGL